jgi:hypothetical protein
MNLLTGIISRSGLSPSKTIASQTTSSSSSSGLTITGANATQLYVLIHSAYNATTNLTAPSTPSGFTSLTSSTNNRIVSRISYRILTSNTASFSLPSVTNASEQTAVAFIYNPINSTFSSVQFSEVGWTYQTGDPSEISLEIGPAEIAIGVLSTPVLSYGYSTNLSNKIEDVTTGTFSTSVVTDVSPLISTPDTARFNAGDSGAAILNNLCRLKPIFS